MQTRRFDEILARCKHPIALVKIDIEGSEYALLDGTTRETWEPVPAIMTELHDDPAGRATPESWLKRIAEFGFRPSAARVQFAATDPSATLTNFSQGNLPQPLPLQGGESSCLPSLRRKG